MVNQPYFPHKEQHLYFLGLPAAFQRMPPRSHTDTLCPQEQVTFHFLDSSSMLLAHDFGTSDVMISCNVLIFV